METEVENSGDDNPRQKISQSRKRDLREKLKIRNGECLGKKVLNLEKNIERKTGDIK